MAHIYKITNLLNGKIYVGKTNFTLEDRWKLHIKDSKKESQRNRPLYSAIRKYGEQNFKVEMLEEVHENQSAEREIYWINKLNSFHYGYNATLGGEGRRTIDYNLVVKTYLEVQNRADVSKILNIDAGHVAKILKTMGVEEKTLSEKNSIKYGVKVAMIDLKTNKIIKAFNSLADAANYIMSVGLSKAKNNSSVRVHIKQAAEGKRKTAFKHGWKLI